MHTDQSTEKFFQSKVLGHPAGLFVLFFTEMWERFSFYGMRVLLVLFLTMSFIGTNPGWEFSSGEATALFGTYASLLYLTPIIGGILADKFLGYRMAVVVGALIMTLGHVCMALETEFSLYLGLGLLVVGTGFFKPNITSIISTMYKDLPKKKDGAYTIFYMGVNAGAFFGMMLCGYIGEKVGWQYGFSLAGIFMLLGALQFWLAKPLFGTIGDKPVKGQTDKAVEEVKGVELTKESVLDKATQARGYRPNPFTLVDLILVAISVSVGLVFIINDPMFKISGFSMLPQELNIGGSKFNGPLLILVIFGLLPFLFLIISRIIRYDQVVKGRMFAVMGFAIFLIFFTLTFEQGATSLVLFADNFTDRVLVGNSAIVFNVVNILLTVGPLLIISWVLLRLFIETWAEIKWSNIVLGTSFVLVWIMAIWMINRDLSTKAYEFKTQMISYQTTNPDDGTTSIVYEDFTDSTVVQQNEKVIDTVLTFNEIEVMQPNAPVRLVFENGKYERLDATEEAKLSQQMDLHKRPSPIITGTVVDAKAGGVEIAASWFSILNSFFIIALASFFSRWWESKYNPSPAMKYAIGLFFIAFGFAVMAYGSIPIGDGTHNIRVNMVWLIIAYFLHTLGELCISPVGLSMVSKLVPARMIGFMFGMWYLAIAIGNKIAASLGGAIEPVVAKYDMMTFFLIFTVIAAFSGLIVMLLNPLMKRWMGGVH
ncbi:MAG: peptide MFS transporter [Crocinitomicaceae bacterium]|nr:peptide MFS transporter [Crocinitomicaceae bacterium]